MIILTTFFLSVKAQQYFYNWHTFSEYGNLSSIYQFELVVSSNIVYKNIGMCQKYQQKIITI